MSMNTTQVNQADAKSAKASIDKGDYSFKHLQKLAAQIAGETGYPTDTVYHFLRGKVFKDGDLKTINIIRSLLEKQANPAKKAPVNVDPKTTNTKQTASTADYDLSLHQIFDLKNSLQQQKTQVFKEASRLPVNNRAPQEAPAQLSKTVASPREFASLLVNNKAAFLLLKSNPIAFNAILAQGNQQIHMNPMMMSELSKLVAQFFKLRQGKAGKTEDDDKAEFDRNQEAILESTDHEHVTVNNIRETINQMPIGKLKDFLLEAERFAEEEIANMWSISLKKEKQLEKMLSKLPEELKHTMEKFPHLDPKSVLEKFKQEQKRKNKSQLSNKKSSIQRLNSN